MGRVIAITNQKGGVGKTTTAINLACCLSEAEQRVLLIDFDPQANSTSGLSAHLEKDREGSIYDLLCGNMKPEECMYKDVLPGLDFISADMDLSGVEAEFQELPDMDVRLKNITDSLKEGYDYIFIDCPPSISVLTVNALTAADSVIIPIQCEYYALEGLNQLLRLVGLVRKKMNPELYVEGVLFTMYDQRTRLSEQVVESVRENLDEPIFETLIPRNVRLAEAPSYGEPISIYDPSSRGAESYRMLAAELMDREGGSY